jgi:alpha-ribazole phosphatase
MESSLMIFLRHPKPAVEAGICYGQLDLDIHAEGRLQIRHAIKTIPRARAVVASPALRCRDLAQAIATQYELEPQFDDRLWEMHMGDWEGLPWREIPRELSEPWMKDPYNLRCPGGESFRDLQLRVLAAIKSLNPETVIVCHAGPIRAVQMAWLGLTFAEVFAQTPPYAEPIIIEKRQL